MELITVRCKGNLGIHPEHGEIFEGRILAIRPDQMSEELFEPAPASASTTVKLKGKTETKTEE